MQSRISSIDTLRGAVMIIMVLDHVRDLFHSTALINDPTDIKTTTAALFFTRWITHLCAPTFVFLSGTSAWLSSSGAADKHPAARHWLKRGLLLVLLEFTVINFGIWFDVSFHTFLLQVIGAIGFSFIILSACYGLGSKALLIAGIAIIVLHQATGLLPSGNDALKQIHTVVFTSTAVPLGPGRLLIIGYPVVPWLGIFLFGYGMGRVFQTPDFKKRVLLCGLLMLAAFILLRFLNSYGDPAPWATQKSGFFTFLSFINVSKYPPSLLFCLLMLGLSFTALGILPEKTGRFAAALQVYGKVPFFFYLLHWYIIHIAMFILVLLQGYSFSDLNFGAFGFGRPKEGFGLQLWGVYLVWMLVVLLFYPLCRWYWEYKKRHREKMGWLKYV